MQQLERGTEAIAITGIETLVVNAEMRNWVFVKVVTDQPGLHGWGEASLNWKTRAVTGTVGDLEPLLIGRDPRDIEQNLEIMRKHSYYRLGIIGMTAISGIEHALFDIFGKSLGLPVWRLLGGKCRDKVRVYTHLGLGESDAVYGTFDPEPLADRARAVKEMGYDALKVVFIPYGGAVYAPADCRRVEILMATLRDAVGPDFDLMVDFHGRPGSVAAALQMIERLTPYEPMFCEEPLQPGDTEGLVRVAARAGCPIASGERLIGLEEFLPPLTARAMHVAQPDLNHTGGLIEGKRIAALAQSLQVGIAPHNPNGPLAGIAALHYDVTVPNFIIQEEMSGAVPWYDEVVCGGPAREGAWWGIPDRPGLGIEIDEQAAARHPFEPERMQSSKAVLADGTMANW